MLAVLLLDPWAVLAAGFWLSFGAVGLIFYVSQGWTGHDAVQPANVVKSESQVERELRQRELQPALPESRSVPRWSVAGWLTPWLSQWGRIQWAITVGLAPAVLLLFSQVSLVGPLANALAIPVVSGIITPLALIGAAVPLDAILQLADLLTVWLLGFLAWCDALPLALWQQPAPPPWSVLVALLGVLWLLAPRGVASRWVGLLLFIPALCVVPPRPAHGEAWVITLDVGQGLAVLVLTAEHALLYDTGPTWGSDSDSGERIIAPYLRAVGARNLDAMIVTHNDSDHSGGAVSVMRNAEVGWLASSLSPGNPLARMAADSRRCERGQRWQWDGVEFAFLHPSREDYADASLKNNNLSCVLRIASAHGSMLLTGDVERAAESLLVAREGTDLRAEVLLAPHHGSRTSSTAEFLAAVRPQWVVVPVGYRNRFGHPRADVLARYAEINARVRRTDFDGALTARLAEGGITVYGEREVRPRYWYAARL